MHAHRNDRERQMSKFRVPAFGSGSINDAGLFFFHVWCHFHNIILSCPQPLYGQAQMSEEASGSINKKALPVVLIVGAGRGIGAAVAKRFALGEYHVVLVRRSDSAQLKASVCEIEAMGGRATGFLMDATTASSSSISSSSSSTSNENHNQDPLESLIDKIETTVGPIRVAVYNLGAQIGSRSLQETSMKQFELGWKLGTFGLFRLAKYLLPRMAAARSGGSLLVTSSTAAMRGDMGQASHAAAMGGRQRLCQALHAEYARHNVHVAHIVIDSPVDSPDTLGKLLGDEHFDKLRQDFQTKRGGLVDPKAVAGLYWYLHHQPPSTWTFELDLRSRGDMPWWSSSRL
jgi:NAD(P)-dependent dehydrogenase (short-subunit alcohol dehydrogenase family)